MAAGLNGSLCVLRCLTCALGFIQQPGSLSNTGHYTHFLMQTDARTHQSPDAKRFSHKKESIKIRIGDVPCCKMPFGTWTFARQR
jgi:hypothetical protein